MARLAALPGMPGYNLVVLVRRDAALQARLSLAATLGLTPRQREVLSQLARGRANRSNRRPASLRRAHDRGPRQRPAGQGRRRLAGRAGRAVLDARLTGLWARRGALYPRNMGLSAVNRARVGDAVQLLGGGSGPHRWTPSSR